MLIFATPKQAAAWTVVTGQQAIIVIAVSIATTVIHVSVLIFLAGLALVLVPSIPVIRTLHAVPLTERPRMSFASVKKDMLDQDAMFAPTTTLEILMLLVVNADLVSVTTILIFLDLEIAMDAPESVNNVSLTPRFAVVLF